MTQPKLATTRTRANTVAAKQERRTALLCSAALLFASHDFDSISVAGIAKGAGLAKGTVYLYFGTKEALFLQLLADEMDEWFNESAIALADGVSSAAEVAHVIASTLTKRPVLPRLLGLLHPVLERNVDGDVLLAFKSQLLEVTANSAKLFERNLKLKPGAGVHLTLWMHSITIGLAQIAAPAPAIRALLETNQSLSTFQIDFSTEIELALGALFRGIEGKQNHKNSPHRK
jgi:AcrR family transcriptional regulator